MTITFEHDNQVLKLTVRIGNVNDPHIGYRIGNHVLLKEDVFMKFHAALKEDDFACIRDILSNVLVMNSNELPNKQNTPQVSYI